MHATGHDAATQHSMLQHSTACCNTAQHVATQHSNTAQHVATQHNMCCCRQVTTLQREKRELQAALDTLNKEERPPCRAAALRGTIRAARIGERRP